MSWKTRGSSLTTAKGSNATCTGTEIVETCQILTSSSMISDLTSDLARTAVCQAVVDLTYLQSSGNNVELSTDVRESKRASAAIGEGLICQTRLAFPAL